MTDETKENQPDFQDELKSIKDEMKELKEMLKKKAKEEAENLNINDNKGGFSRNFRIELDDDELNFEGVDDTLSSYLGSIMEGVASSLSSSMKQMTQGFGINITEEMARAKEELERNKHHIERDIKRAKREAERAAKEAERAFKHGNRSIIRFHKLSEEELDRFYTTAPDLTSALSDEKKLRLLKALEKGPMYQKDLSEQTDIKGGTFKHHMDSLVEVKFIQQEAVRGRYLITQLGIEALKLSEMLFRRFIFATEDHTTREGVDVDVEMDEDLETEIEMDISNDQEAVGDVQNEEEEG